MRTCFLIFFCLFSTATVHAACDSNIPASTPDSQLIDNDNGTVTDSKTGLMWKQCLEGLSGADCATGIAYSFTWQTALQRPKVVNAGGFAGYTDWRLPDIAELESLVEKQCHSPAINTTRFPNTPSSSVWSGSAYANYSGIAWYVGFNFGYSNFGYCFGNYGVRLVRGGQ